MSEAETQPMPLARLADEIIRLSEHHASTPVLITPVYLAFRAGFFVELSRQLATRCQRDLRFDWFRSGEGLISEIGTRLSRFHAARIRRALAADRHRNTLASIVITAAISRPGGVQRDLVVGLCHDGCELPLWATPIRLGGSPTSLLNLQ